MRKMVTFASLAFAASMLAACAENKFPGNDRAAEESPETPLAELASPEEAARQADLSATHPATMAEKEYGKVVSGRSCRFSYTSVGHPVLVMAAGSAQGPAVMKLNGKLFELQAKSDADGGVARAAGITAAVTPEEGDGDGLREAELKFRIEGAEELGYWGYYSCG